jgi:hypothetical protein
MNNDYGGNRGFRRAGLPAVVAVLATVTACGGSASSSAREGRQTRCLPTQSACARGVPSFPDPTVSGGGAYLRGTFDFDSPQFKDAEHACKTLIPAGLFPATN